MMTQNISNTACVLALALFLIFTISSCRKDEIQEAQSNNPNPADTTVTTPTACDSVEIGAYFPAYANSSWWYTKSNGGQYQIQIDSAYYSIYLGKCAPRWINPYYADWYIDNTGLTRYDGGITPGAASWQGGNIYQLDTVGHSFLSTFGFGRTHLWYNASAGANYKRTIENLDTTINLTNGQTYDQVLVIKETYIYDSVRYYDYFKEGVGLIKRDSAIPYLDSTLYEVMSLDSFVIGG